ncbi:hypothetical protein EST38_g1938 [Candolleomyces aberdarensis]|uniref:Uncharacterized protein n=1 Tax=Candolleomyces aberdarensis TaxID=2316362 RepID=A0A4Q2DX01_9AGAR|nr:hypothetical protein EST38_g1938 [Candolleomyces aberdarensis]
MDPQDTAGKWIQVYGGDMVPVILQLVKGPTLGLIEGGKDGEDSHPMYVARAVSANGCYPGEYGSHISGARISRDGAVRIVRTRL